MIAKKKTYKEIQAQIDALQAEAVAVKTQEIATAISEIRAKIAAYSLTPEILFGPSPKLRGKYKTRETEKPTRVMEAIAPKYRDPRTGETWTGRGRAPKWIASAKNRDRFLITPDASAK